MENRSANIEEAAPTKDIVSSPGKHVAPTFPIRHVVGYGVGGAAGGAIFAIIQHLGPGFLTEPPLVRWVFLYALLGGVVAGVWRATTRWVVAQFSLSRWGAVTTSGLLAGMFLGAATVLVATLTQGDGDGTLLLRLPWADGLGGFLGGAVGGGLWQLMSPHLCS